MNSQNTQAGSHTFTLYSRVLVFLKPYCKLFFTALFCMVLFGATDGGVPFLIKYILDGVFVSKDTHLLYLLPVALIIFAIIRGLLDFAQQFLMAKVGLQIIRDMRTAIHRHLLEIEPIFFVRHSSAEIVSTITSDVGLMRGLLTDALAAVLRDLVRVVALTAAALYMDATLALIALVVMPFCFYPVHRFSKRIRALSRRGQDAIGGLSSIMQESALGNRVVKIFGQEKLEAKRFTEKNQELTTTMIRSERDRAITGPINEVVASFAISGVLLYGGYSVVSGVRTQGDFIAFLISVFLLYDPIKRLSRVNGVVQQALAGAERIFELLDLQPKVKEPLDPIKLGKSNEISIEQVSFAYEQGDSAALTEINLDIAQGAKVALVGFSGAGKSTLVDLLPRFIDPDSGVIRIGGVDISKVAIKELRERIAMVGQHTFLFNDTIYNNIAYGKPGATEQEIQQAARAAYAEDFILKLPQGYQTFVGESGLSLSGGERQRLAIARAILKGAPILILDEATAALDNRAEREVQAALDALEQGKTTVVIAHRLSTVRNADLIVVLKAGRIVEVGNHDQLLANNQGEYAKLYAMQFASNLPEQQFMV